MNFVAYMILLTVQAVLFMFRDVTVVTGSHPSFFFPNLLIPFVQVVGYPTTHFTIFNLVMYPVILFIQSVVYF